MYNGYTNYESWVVALWVDNDEYLNEMARNIDNVEEFKEFMEDSISEQVESTSGLVVDLLNAALDDVNWVEVFEAVRED